MPDVTSPSSPAASESSEYSLKPILFEAAAAHREGFVEYEDDGTVICRHPALAARGAAEVRIPPSRQFPAIRATFDALNKALSSMSNSPALEDGRTLRQAYDDEVARYDDLVAAAYAEGRFEPDYGVYMLDQHRGDLYLIAPERWHRLALVTSNAKLLADPACQLTWREIRQRLEGAVVGFAGISVGSNILEGWLREARPKYAKIADPDWVEVTNLNRGERMSLRHVVGSRAERFDIKNPYDSPRVAKAEYCAYEQNLVDPFLQFSLYKEGISRANIDRFLLGDGGREPRIDVLVEEMDDFDLKVLVRERCRVHGIDVLMLSDFGNQAHVLWNPYRTQPDAPLGYGVSDEVLLGALEAARKGDRSKVFEFIGALCGADFAADQFKAWVEGRGEQPTSSLPQVGATAMASGAIGGKELALHILGHHLGAPTRVVYDLQNRRLIYG